MRPASGPGDKLCVTYVGHATVAIGLGGTSLLTDPILRSRVAFLRWTTAVHSDVFPSLDVVLISHLHHDHCDPRSLALLGHDKTLLVPWGTERFFRRRGFTDVVPMKPGDGHQLGRVSVVATEAEHDGRRHPFSAVGTAIGYVVADDGVGTYFAGDTDLFAGMSALGRKIDVALLPVAGWGRSLGPGHLDPVRAAEAVDRIRPALAIPIHWGTMRPVWHRSPSLEQTDAPATAFTSEVRRRRLATEVRVLAPGDSLTWPV